MVSFPPCKINLGLQVVRKRPDGFHDLETCFYRLPWTDVLEIVKATETKFTSSGIVIPGNPSDNLCLRAYELLRQEYELTPVKIHLHKIIPTGAGLGGGSSDAAYTLRMLNLIFSLGVSQQRLMDYAATLGSDCAFFMQDQPKLGKGRGEVLSTTTVSLKGRYVLLIKPEIHVSTAQAFGGITPKTPEHSLEAILMADVSSWKDVLKNDFEITVFKAHPRIAEIKRELYSLGAVYAAMSGSGSSVFGIFDKPPVWLHPSNDSVHWAGLLN